MAERPYWPGDVVDVWLAWAGQDGWPDGAEVFAHLRVDGDNVGQNDGTPRYFVKYDAAGRACAGRAISDWRQLVLPVGCGYGTAHCGRWQWGYMTPKAASGPLCTDRTVTPLGDELIVGRLKVGPPPVPDQTCALIPETCASQRK